MASQGQRADKQGMALFYVFQFVLVKQGQATAPGHTIHMHVYLYSTNSIDTGGEYGKLKNKHILEMLRFKI